MQRGAILPVALLTLGAVVFCAGAAPAEENAPPAGSEFAAVRTELSELAVHHELTRAELRALAPPAALDSAPFDCAQGKRAKSGRAGAERAGWTRLALNAVTGLETTFVTTSRGDKTFWVSTVRVTLRYQAADIYVAAEYPPESAKGRTILAHEREHVRADRALVEEFAAKIRSALLTAAFPTYARPLKGASAAAGSEQVEGQLRGILDPLMEELEKKRRSASEGLDGAPAASEPREK